MAASEDDRGTTALLKRYAPEDAVELASRPVAPTAPTRPVTGVRDRDSIRILVVEPETAIRGRLRLCLGRDFEIVGEFADGIDALGAMPRARPDIVLVALDLPGLDGIEILKLITERHPEVYPILHAAEAEVDLMQRAMAAGARNFLLEPLDPEELRESLVQGARHCRALQRRSRAATRPPNAGMWCFAGATGGAGRTTLSIAAAHQLAGRGHRAVIVDLDLFFGDQAFYLGLEGKHPGLAELIERDDFLDSAVLEDHLQEHPGGFHVLAAPPDMFRASSLDLSRCVMAARSLTQLFDFVMVDLPPGLGDHYVELLDDARHVFVSGDGSIGSLKNLRSYVRVLQEMGYEQGKIHPVLTRLDPTSRTLQEHDQVLEKIGSRIAFDLPRDPKAIEDAVMSGKPAGMVDPDQPYVRAVRRIVEQFLESSRPETAPRRRGLIARFLGQA